MTYLIGWDIGGAHVKMAVINEHQIIAIHQKPCPLWQGLDQLESTVQQLLKTIVGHKNQKHAITMTGELVDLFTDRQEGVRQILHIMKHLLSCFDMYIFCGKHGLRPIAEIDQSYYEAIASINWLVSAAFAAQSITSCLFVDMGSTTTDILLCDNAMVQAQGFSDYERLISQELVYCGMVRTPVMAVVQSVLDQDKIVGVMAEYFATMADVYRLTGELIESHDQHPTADGLEKNLIASGRRLSRMLGDDFKIEEIARWQAIALYIREQQVKRLQRSCELRLQGKKIPFVGAGIGRFLIKEIAENLALPYVDFSTLCPVQNDFTFNSADCAPAVAVANLLIDL